jgi:DNA-binding beta-propeller fold protein YncE
MQPWLIALLSVVVVGAALVVWRGRDYVPPPPPYSGPVIYAAVPAEHRVVVLQAGPSVDAAIPVPTDAELRAVSPSGGTAYLAVLGGLMIVDTANHSPDVLPTIIRWANLGAMAMHPAGTVLAAAAAPGHQRYPNGHGVLFFDLATRQLKTSISLTGMPTALAFSNDGSLLYAAREGAVDVLAVEPLQLVKTHSSTTHPLSQPSKVLLSPTGLVVYVLANGMIAAIEVATGAVSWPISYVGNWNDFVLSPDGTRLLAASNGGVEAFDPFTGYRLGGTTVYFGNAAPALAMNKDGNRTLLLGGEDASDIVIVNTEDGSFFDTIPLAREYRGLMLDPKRPTAYTVGEGKLTLLNLTWLTSGREIATIPTGNWPASIAISALTGKAYVSNLFGKSITVIDTHGRSVSTTWPLDFHPRHVKVNFAGTKLFCTDAGGSAIWIMDTGTGAATSIPLDARAEAIDLNSQDTLLFAALQSIDKVAVISLVTGVVLGHIDATGPTDLAVRQTPDGERLFVAHAQKGQVSVFTAALPEKAWLNLYFGELARLADSWPGPLYALDGQGWLDTIYGGPSVGRGVLLSGNPRELAPAFAGHRAYVSNGSGSIWQVNNRKERFVASVGAATGTGAIAVL